MNRVSYREECISDLEDRRLDITQSGQQKGKQVLKKVKTV